MAALADNLRAIRAHYGMTQEFVAGRIGVSRAAYARWESGASSPHPSNLDRMADFYCVSREQLEGNAPLELSWALSRWRAREYEQSIGREDEYAGELLAALSDQAIVLEAAKRFYKVIVQFSKLIETAEKMDWESAAKAINAAADRGEPYPEDKAHFLKVYELLGDLRAEIVSRYSLNWVARNQQDKMPSSGGGDVPVYYEDLEGRYARLLDRLADKQGAVYKWLSQRSVSSQHFARLEDLISATKAALGLPD